MMLMRAVVLHGAGSKGPDQGVICQVKAVLRL
jgi:hypothetical protein